MPVTIRPRTTAAKLLTCDEGAAGRGEHGEAADTDTVGRRLDMNDDDETGDPHYADRRNFYKVEKWSRALQPFQSSANAAGLPAAATCLQRQRSEFIY